MYLIAASHDRSSACEELARRLLVRPIRNVYSPEMEIVSADLYQTILQFHHRCQVRIYKLYKSRECESNIWRNRWFFGSSQSGKYSRSIPIVLVEAGSIRGDDISSLVEESRKLEEEVEAALQKVNALLSSSWVIALIRNAF